MKIRAPKQIIESILINLQPFLEKKDMTQITSHVYFDANADGCIVKATDNEIGLQIRTDMITTDHPGTFTAHGKKLLDIVRILKDDEIVLEVLDNTLYIKQKHSKFKLPTFDASAFPEFPNIDGKAQISLDSTQLIRNLKKISPAIDTNNPKFELNGALINIKNDATDLVGTDTRRLAIATIDEGNEETLSLIVPKKATMEIQKLFLDQIAIHYDETNMIITNDNYFFYTRLINGKFPDYERIIPQSTKYAVTLPVKEMMESIKMITTISQEIKLSFLPDKIVFQSHSVDNVEAKTELEMQTGIENRFDISFNSRYMLDFLSQCDKGEFTMAMNETSLPFIVQSDNFMTIIMPIVA